jgi:hypothetical protein
MRTTFPIAKYLQRTAGQSAVSTGRPGFNLARSLYVKPSLAHGVAGISKAIVGAGGASLEVIQRRTAICAGCEHGKVVAGMFQQCDLCACWTWAKVRNAGEACPINKWPAESPASESSTPG